MCFAKMIRVIRERRRVFFVDIDPDEYRQGWDSGHITAFHFLDGVTLILTHGNERGEIMGADAIRGMIANIEDKSKVKIWLCFPYYCAMKNTDLAPYILDKGWKHSTYHVIANGGKALVLGRYLDD